MKAISILYMAMKAIYKMEDNGDCCVVLPPGGLTGNYVQRTSKSSEDTAESTTACCMVFSATESNQ